MTKPRESMTRHTKITREMPVEVTIGDMYRVMDLMVNQGAPTKAIIRVRHLIGAHLDRESTILEVEWEET